MIMDSVTLCFKGEDVEWTYCIWFSIFTEQEKENKRRPSEYTYLSMMAAI